MHDFSWGDPICVREELDKQLFFRHMPEGETFATSLGDLTYPPHMGDEKLIELMRVLIKKTLGIKYEHVFITNGATNAIGAAIYAKRTVNTNYVVTDKTFFGFYPGIIGASGLDHIKGFGNFSDGLYLIDSPSNPTGVVRNQVFPGPVIFDACYNSLTYGATAFTPLPKHSVALGSLSKTLGLPGLRLGWIATDDLGTANHIKDYITHDLCGVSIPSQNMAKKIMSELDFDRFFMDSKAAIDNNREEFEKVGKMLGQKMPEYGMFAFWETDLKFRKLLEKKKVKWTCGSSVGSTEEWVRLNLAQNNSLTKTVVRSILK